MHHSLGLSLVLSNCLTAHYLVTFVLPVCYLLHRSSYVTKQMSQKVTYKGNTFRACYSFSDVLLQCIIFYFSLSFFPFIVFLLLLLLLLLLLFCFFVFFPLTVWKMGFTSCFSQGPNFLDLVSKTVVMRKWGIPDFAVMVSLTCEHCHWVQALPQRTLLISLC